MKITSLMLVAALLMAAPAPAQDMMNLGSVQIIKSPGDVATWPATVRIAGISIDANVGIDIQTAAPIPWPDTPNQMAPDGSVAMGPLQYTVWVCVQPFAWKCAGFIQMWRNRAMEDARALPPLPSQWSLWWGPFAGGAANGDFGGYVPRPGDTIGMFIASGDERANLSVTTVRERSNVVTFALVAGDTASFDFAPVAPPPVVPPPSPLPPPVVTPPSSSDTDVLLSLFGDLETKIVALQKQQADDTARILAAFPLPAAALPIPPSPVIVNGESAWLKVLTSIATGAAAIFAGIGASK